MLYDHFSNDNFTSCSFFHIKYLLVNSVISFIILKVKRSVSVILNASHKNIFDKNVFLMINLYVVMLDYLRWNNIPMGKGPAWLEPRAKAKNKRFFLIKKFLWAEICLRENKRILA